jgi:hypothetical protein
MKKKEKIKKLKEEVASLKCRLLALEGIIEQPVYWECVHDDGYGCTEGEIYREVYKEGNLISLKADTGDLVLWDAEYENVIYNGYTCFRKVPDKGIEPQEEPKEQPVYWECIGVYGYNYTKGKKYKEIYKEGNFISLREDKGDLVRWLVDDEKVTYNGYTCFRKVTDKEKLVLDGYLISEFKSDTRNELQALFKQFLVDKKLKFI